MNRTAHKIILHPIHLDAVRDYISLAFKGDARLQDFHIAPSGSYQQMATHAAKQIIGLAHTAKVDCYRVKYDSADGTVNIGFVALMKEPVPTLYSFGINKRFRTGPVLANFMEAINEKLGDVWLVHLYKKNTRARAFFERNGFEVKAETKETISLCQSQQS